MLSKTSDDKGNNSSHLEKWMQSQLDIVASDEPGMELLSEEWTEEMVRKRSEELRLIDSQGNMTHRSENNRDGCRCEDLNHLSDQEQSPSKSTTTESQITVRSSPLVPETVPVCRQCHKNCFNLTNGDLSNKDDHVVVNNHLKHNNTSQKQIGKNNNKDNDWQPLVLMGLSALNPAARLVKLDPFSASVPQISIAPPTPENSARNQKSNTDFQNNDYSCNCNHSAEFNNINYAHDVDISPDDSPETEEHPYHSLSSSNLTLRRYGTVSSLERYGTDDENWDDNDNGSLDDDEEEDDEQGIDNEAFYHSSIRNWTAKAGSFVADKMAFFERLGEDYRNNGTFFDRYRKTTDDPDVNGDDNQEDETSGATSGEEVWGTPTSGGDTEDPLSSPNYDDKQSPNEGSLSSDNGDDTELMMDELLMTPPITGAVIRGLLPRRTLEPLIEEDYSESYSTSSSATPTEPSASPEQGNDTGDVADTCSIAAENPGLKKRDRGPTSDIPSVVVTPETSSTMKIHRSESYRHIIEAADDADDNVNFFDRFKPTVKFINIERVPRSRSVKIFEFFNVRRERRAHQTFPENGQLIKVFSKEGTISDDVPTSYSEKPISPRRLKDKQLDRRFWKQLSRRRENKTSNLPAT